MLLKKWVLLFDHPVFLRALFFLFLLIIISTRVLLFLSVNLNSIDSDQPFMWMGASDYARGLFYEPRYYGQNYNSFMEGFFAVPLLWLNVPVYYAVPIATHFIWLFPFFSTALYLYRKGFFKHAVFVLSIPLCLPLGYDILTGIPRGFVTGLFFASFFIRSLLQPNHVKWLVFNTIMAVLAYFINANSVLASLPFLFFLFLNNYKNKSYYVATFFSMLSAFLFYALFDWFYVLHPGYIIYALVNEFSLSYFLRSLSHLNDVFVHLSFFKESCSVITFLLCASLAIALFKYNVRGFYAFLIFFGALCFSFFASKVHEGSLWAYYSYSRMFIALPFVLALFGTLLPLKKNVVMLIIVFATFGFSGYKLFHFNRSVNFNTDEKKWVGVHLVSLKNALDAIEHYKITCKENKHDTFIIANRFWASTFLNYGSHAIDENYPFTSETNSERRYTIREQLKNKVIQNFVYLSTNYNLDADLPKPQAFTLQRLDDYGLYLVRNNTLVFPDFCTLVRNVEPND